VLTIQARATVCVEGPKYEASAGAVRCSHKSEGGGCAYGLYSALPRAGSAAKVLPAWCSERLGCKLLLLLMLLQMQHLATCTMTSAVLLLQFVLSVHRSSHHSITIASVE